MRNLVFSTDPKTVNLDVPTLVLRKKLLSSHYYVDARFADGSFKRVAEFFSKPVAEYWLEVEGEHWLESHGLNRIAA